MTRTEPGSGLARRRLLTRTTAALLAAPLLARAQPVATELVFSQVADFSASRGALGRALRAGIQTAFAQANEAGGVAGQRLRLVTRDDAYAPNDTVRLVREALAVDRPLALIGTLGTANLAELRRSGVIETGGVPLIAPYTGADSLREPVSRLIFHIRASYAQEVDAIVRYLSTIGAKFIAVFHENDAFGNFIYDAYAEANRRHGTINVARIRVERGQTDFRYAIEPLTRIDHSGVLVGTAGEPTVNFIRTARGMGLRQHYLGLSVNDLPSIVAKAGAEAARGFGQVQVVPDPGACKGQRICAELIAQYERHGDRAVPLSPVVMEGFIAGRVVVEGLRRVRGRPTASALVTALESFSPLDLGGYVLNFGPGQRNGSRYLDVGVINGRGQMVY